MKILVITNADMSSSLLVKKMEEYGRTRDLALTVVAVSAVEAREVLAQYDVALVAPQVRFEQSAIEAIASPLGIPVGLIDMQVYAAMNGSAVIQQAQALLERGAK